MKQLLNPRDLINVGTYIYIPPIWYRIYDVQDKHPKRSWIIAGCVYGEGMYPIYKTINKSEIILPAYILLIPKKDTILETDEFFSRRNPQSIFEWFSCKGDPNCGHWYTKFMLPIRRKITTLP